MGREEEEARCGKDMPASLVPRYGSMSLLFYKEKTM